MKTTLLVLMFLSQMSFAKDCKITKSQSSVQDQFKIDTKVPKWLQGATIVVRQADGKESVVSADKFKVVPRKQQFIVTKTKETEQLTCSAGDDYKNRLSLLGGTGPKGNLKVTQPSADKAVIETNGGVTAGVQYQRKITDRLSIGGQIQTNESGAVLIGLDF